MKSVFVVIVVLFSLFALTSAGSTTEATTEATTITSMSPTTNAAAPIIAGAMTSLLAVALSAIFGRN